MNKVIKVDLTIELHQRNLLSEISKSQVTNKMESL